MKQGKSRAISLAVVNKRSLRLVGSAIVLSGLIAQWLVPILPTHAVAAGKPAVTRREVAQPSRNKSLDEQARNALATLPLSFESNVGQANRRFRFLSRASGFSVALASSEAVFGLAKATGKQSKRDLVGQPPSKSIERSGVTLTMRLLGANVDAKFDGLDPIEAKTNYFIGNDSKKWRTNIANFAKVQVHNVYDRVDVVYYGNRGQLEYDFVVGAGGDPNKIHLEFMGANKIEINSSGDLILHTPAGEVRQRKPVIYQEVDGTRREVSGGYLLRGKQVGFQLGSYDPTRPLVIDPSIVYSTFLTGGLFPDGSVGSFGQGIALHADAYGKVFAYVAGNTASGFPIKNALQPNFAGGRNSWGGDAFVAKLNMTASGDASVLYATYLGGAGNDWAGGVAVDSAGNAFLTGGTESTDFPTQQGLSSSPPGSGGAFVTKLSADGSQLLYSTYVSGTGRASGIAVDSGGNAYIAGAIGSDNLPTVNAYQTTRGSASAVNTFVCKIAPPSNGNPATLLYSTYLGGSDTVEYTGDVANSIAIGSSGKIYVAGDANSHDFPIKNGFQSIDKNPGGYAPAFVAVLDPSLAGPASLIYSTYLGGSAIGGEHASAIAVDASGNAYVTGYTCSGDFPITPGAYRSTLAGGDRDAFVAKIDPSRTGSASLIYATYLGGTNFYPESGNSIAVDSSGHAFIAGNSDAYDLPTVNAVQTFNGGVVQSVDDGVSFSNLNKGITNPQIDVIAVDSSTVPRTLYAGTHDGLFKSTDGGLNWHSASNGLAETDPNTGIVYQDIHSVVINPVVPSTLYAGGNAGLFKSIDGGEHWTEFWDGMSDSATLNTLSLDTTTSNGHTVVTIYAGTQDGLYKMVDGSAQWSRAGLDQKHIGSVAIDPRASPHTLYVGMWDNGGAAKSVDGGSTWEHLLVKSNSEIFLAVDSRTNPSTIYAVNVDEATTGSGIFKSADSGENWEITLRSPDVYMGQYLRSALVIDNTTAPSTIFVVDRTGAGLWKSTDEGSNWTRLLKGAATLAIDAASTSPSTLYAGKSVNQDAYIAKLNPTGSALLFSTYLGGVGEDFPKSIALDNTGNIYMAGFSSYNGFPTVNAYQSSFGGGSSAFVMKLGDAALPPISTGSTTTQIGTQTGTLALTFPNITGSTSGSAPTATVNPVDDATLANLTLSNNVGAYDITTTAIYDTSGYTTDPTKGIKLTFNVITVNDPIVFNGLVVTHGEDANGDGIIQPNEMIPYNGTVDPNKITGHDFATRTVWIYVPSLSPFVIVKGAPDQFGDLVRLVKTFNLKAGIQNSLDGKLQNALKAYQAALAKDRATACNQMGAFVYEVQAQTGKALTEAQATQLTSAANQIKVVLGCR